MTKIRIDFSTIGVGRGVAPSTWMEAVARTFGGSWDLRWEQR